MRIFSSAHRVAISTWRLIVSLLFCVSCPGLSLRRPSFIFTCTCLLPSLWCKSGPKQGQVRSPRSRSLWRKPAYSPGVRWQPWKPHRNREKSQLCSLVCPPRSCSGRLSRCCELSAPNHWCFSYTDETVSKAQAGDCCNVPAQSSGLGYSGYLGLFRGTNIAELSRVQAKRQWKWSWVENMEKRERQPLGKTTAKDEGMCSRRKQIKEPQGNSGPGYGGGCTQRLGQTDANHCRSISQWNQWSGVNLQELSCVSGKYYGMDHEAAAHTELPLTLPVAPRTEAEVIHVVKKHGVSSSSQWLEAGEGILNKQLCSP